MLATIRFCPRQSQRFPDDGKLLQAPAGDFGQCPTSSLASAKSIPSTASLDWSPIQGMTSTLKCWFKLGQCARKSSRILYAIHFQQPYPGCSASFGLWSMYSCRAGQPFTRPKESIISASSMTGLTSVLVDRCRETENARSRLFRGAG